MNHAKTPLLLALLGCFSVQAHACATSSSGNYLCQNPSYAGIPFYPTSTSSVTLDNPAMVVTGSGVLVGPSQVAPAVASTTIEANRFNSVNTTAAGVNGRGMMSTNQGSATVNVTGGTVTTTELNAGRGDAPIGLLAEVLNTTDPNATARVIVNGTTVSTAGHGASGIMAYTATFNPAGSRVLGGARIEASNLTLTTTGDNANGLQANGSSGNTQPIDIVLHSGTVTTRGANAHAVWADSSGSGAVTIDLQAGQLAAQGTGAHGAVAIGPAAVSVNTAAQITSDLGDAINVEGASIGATITMTGGSLQGATAAVRGSPASDTFTASGGAINGLTLMGDGDDSVTLQGAVDVTAATQFDGGTGNNTLTIDGAQVRGFTGSNTPANGVNLTLWQTIQLKNAAKLKLSADLFEAAATAAQLNIDAAATLDASGNSPGVFSIHGTVVNSGALSLADASPAADDKTTVTGNYSGAAGSVLKLDTVLGDSSSASDQLIVNGASSGTTTLQVNNAGGAGAATTGDGILLVQVDGASNASFVLAGGSVTAGQFSYTLHQVGRNWYLQSAAVPPPPPPPPPPPAGNVAPVPALGELGSLALAAALGMAGVRRRKSRG